LKGFCDSLSSLSAMEAIMVAKGISVKTYSVKEYSVKKYVVRLSWEERRQLEKLIGKGKGAARRLLKARILLKADISDAGAGWSDNEIIRALDTSASRSTGCAAIGGGGLCGGVEPQAASDAGGAPNFRWREGGQTYRLGLFLTAQGTRTLDLAAVGEQVVELGIVDRASDSTIGRALKKTFYSAIAGVNGSSRRRPTVLS
jgi:hypothetical protein